MKKIIYGIFALAVLAFLAYTIWNQKNTKTESTTEGQVENTSPVMHTVTVKDFLNTSNYTYIKVAENNQEYWIAVNKMETKKGETLYFSKSLEMKDFHSKELNRTFDKILFVEGITASPDQQATEFVHPQMAPTPESKQKIEPYPGGKTVKDIFANQKTLNGKVVRIRGEVVKVNSGILDRNWIHIQDGTDYNGSYDLLVTSKENVKAGDVVAFEGRIATNKNFGGGYSYPVMMEDGRIIKENKKL